MLLCVASPLAVPLPADPPRGLSGCMKEGEGELFGITCAPAPTEIIGCGRAAAVAVLIHLSLSLHPNYFRFHVLDESPTSSS